MFIIGGRAGVGQGWRMLMETLAAGRSISLPGLAVGGTELALRATGAYVTVREQFGLPLGRFEGIEDPLARIAGHAWLLNATRRFTCAGLDEGERPGVVSAVVKAYLTESFRTCLNDAMDIMAGAAICRGPRNILARAYTGVPIAITVEGANILSRSMIIFGQGAIRCHPYVREEIEAAGSNNTARFDSEFFAHVNFFFRNLLRAPLLALGGSRLIGVPGLDPAAWYLRRLERYSAAFALLTDVALVSFGGALKRRERVNGRFADILAWMYLASAAVKRFQEDGAREEDRPFLEWSCRHAFEQIETAFEELLQNLPGTLLPVVLKRLILPFGRRALPPSDRLAHTVADAVLYDREQRRRLTTEVFIPDEEAPGLGRLEAALTRVAAAMPARRQLVEALRAGRLAEEPEESQFERAASAGVISQEECDALAAAERARTDVIQVDAFTPEHYAELKP